MRVLAVGAHPDDVELQCAGTLARFAARGDTVHIAVATNGEVGSPTLSKAEIARIREEESRASAAIIGAELHWLGYPDEFLYDNDESRLRFIELIRATQADLVIAPDPVCDYHPDHTTTGRILWGIRVMTTVPNIKTASPPAPRVPDLYFMDTLAGINFLPEDYVDITETMELKRKMLASHKSQGLWLRDQYGMEYVEFMEICARYRGLQGGFRFAEAYRRSVTFPAIAGRLLP